MLFQLTADASRSPPMFSLRRCGDFNHNYVVTSLVSRESRLMLGDAIRSLIFLNVIKIPSDTADDAMGVDEPVTVRMEVDGVDNSPLWPVCLQSAGPDSVIGASVRVLHCC